MTENSLKVISDSGKGRAFVTLREEGSNFDIVDDSFIAKTRSIVLETPKISESNWKIVTESLENTLSQNKVRQTIVIGNEATTAIAQNFYLRNPKLVRSLVFFNPVTRPNPTSFEKFTQSVEKKLPLGLPLRSASKGFDSKSFLHRMRCPILLFLLKSSSTYYKEQASMMEKGLTTAWLHEVVNIESEDTKTIIREFVDIPVKCPQKNKK